jgi:TetR/AcrR family transcriptional regulator, regulator of autoinduction and epiphytic fitness
LSSLLDMSNAKKTKILTAARSVFLRYGFKRVSMNDIAEAAGVSRPALYVVFKNKEEIFAGVFLQWVDETVADIEREIATAAAPEEKIERAFEIWTVRPFEMMMNSPEAKELVECSFTFAQAPLRQGYKKFEATIVPILASIAEGHPASSQMSPEKIAHVLASAVRGFKQTAASPVELRQLIKELLRLSFNPIAIRQKAPVASQTQAKR